MKKLYHDKPVVNWGGAFFPTFFEPWSDLSLCGDWNKETALMSLFSKPKDRAAQTFVVRLINAHCPGMAAKVEGPRLDSRVNLVLVATVVPIAQDRLQVDEAFTAVTKDFSSTGVSIVIEQPLGFEQALLGFRLDGQMTFLRGQAIHLDPMGGGFYQLGFQLLDLATSSDYPQLKTLSF